MEAQLLLLSAEVKLVRPLVLGVMEEIVARCARDRGAWRESTTRAADLETFTAAFAGASRHAGRSALGLTQDEVTRLRALGLTWSLARWALDDFARAALLLRAGAALERTAMESLVHRCYRDGDTRERQAILRALPLLPQPRRFLGVAADACRCGIPALFESVACENPYPAAHFPGANFNHMVLEALLNGVTLDRIVGLGARITPELVRRANEYAAERRAAGRIVPADLGYISDTAARTAVA